MTRLSLKLTNDYPRKYLWWMQCDTCSLASKPAWSIIDLPITEFRAAGWTCTSNGTDTCPTCTQKDTKPWPSKTTPTAT